MGGRDGHLLIQRRRPRLAMLLLLLLGAFGGDGGFPILPIAAKRAALVNNHGAEGAMALSAAAHPAKGPLCSTRRRCRRRRHAAAAPKQKRKKAAKVCL